MLVALLASTVLMGMAAVGVDTARWYVEAERLQKAADAAALAGVPYLPARMDKATTAAIDMATKNGFPNSGGSTVTVTQGSRPSELRVTITSRVSNSFAAALGIRTTTISRTALADYTAPAPMGSPCNTFGNEPASTTGAAQPAGSALPSPPFANCSSNPQFWAAVEGPGTDKVNGDRYGNYKCASSSTFKCSSSKNDEYRPEGYFWLIHVDPSAINTKIDLQLFDPAFVATGVDCGNITYGTNLWDRMSAYTPTDGKTRYKNVSSVYCPGDYLNGTTALDTTFLIREPTTSGDPLKSTVVAGCTKTFVGRNSPPGVNSMKQWTTATGSTANTSYDQERARTFHQWVSLCDNGGFTASKPGDYYLQVRTNAKTTGGTAVANTNGNSAVVYKNVSDAGDVDTADDVTTTAGVNAFGIRAVPTDVAKRSLVAVAGYNRMPILQNAAGSTATFNLIRALPTTKGQYVVFDFFDVADCSASCSAKVKVNKPTEATGSFTSGTLYQPCKTALNNNTFTDLTNCTATVTSGANNGQLQHMVVPIPPDYTCDPATYGGCWFSVSLDFQGADVTDITTWDANIQGDPVRLIE